MHAAARELKIAQLRDRQTEVKAAEKCHPHDIPLYKEQEQKKANQNAQEESREGMQSHHSQR